MKRNFPIELLAPAKDKQCAFTAINYGADAIYIGASNFGARKNAANNLEDIKEYADSIICFYSDNDPYVKYEVEKDFADKIATEQIMLNGAGHINAESGYDTFEEIVNYL